MFPLLVVLTTTRRSTLLGSSCFGKNAKGPDGAAAGSRVPVIILTAHGDEEARRQSLEAGAVAFLGKPFRSDALLDAVRTALGM
jgi:CheY-like chemotaxis protein